MMARPNRLIELLNEARFVAALRELLKAPDAEARCG